MKRIVFIIFGLLLLFPTPGLLAQAVNTEEVQSPTVSPVSQEDLKRMTEEMRETTKQAVAAAVTEADKKSAERTAEALRVTQEQNDKNLRQTTETLTTSQEKITGQVAKSVEDINQRTTEAEKSTSRKIYIGLGAFGLVVVLVGGILVVTLRKKRRDEIPMTAKPPQLVLVSKETQEPLTNPDIPTLKKLSESYGKEIHFVRKLEGRGTELDGQTIDCVALMQDEGKNPLVLVGDEKVPVAFDKHTAKAAKMIAVRMRSSQPQEMAS